MFYQVIASIDSRFDSLDEALRVYNTDTLVVPSVPVTHNEKEDVVTPRICVAKDIRDCFTSIGLLGRFRRTLGANEDAKSYATVGKECYPVLILEFLRM